MNNPLKVSLENIIPLTEARDHFSQIVSEVQNDKLYVLTKGGKPAVAIIDVKYLEHITGGEIDKTHLEKEIKKDPGKVGLPPMIEHTESSKPKPIPPPPPPAPFTPPKPAPPIPPPPPKPESPKPAGFAAPPPSSIPSPSSSSSHPPASPKPPAPASPTPLKTPPVEEVNKINVQFYPDKPRETPNSRVSEDDKNPPAQYAGEKDQVEDMKID